MNLLPKTHSDFAKEEYWNKFFHSRGKRSFEWYGEYADLCGHLNKYIKVQDDILVAGCGNSKLDEDLYDVGFRKITNIDISAVAIKNKIRANERRRPEMKSLVMDVTKMDFPDGSFKVVLDKGTLDALMSDDSQQTKTKASLYLAEIARVLPLFGRFICVSLLQEHILQEVLTFFGTEGWILRIGRCQEVEEKNGTFPVFVVVLTKITAGSKAVLETCTQGDVFRRFERAEQVVQEVESVQTLNRFKSASASHSSYLDLFDRTTGLPRYTVHLVDHASAKSGSYAAFIVPQGREHEWLFSAPRGRSQLAKTVGVGRLAVVSLHGSQEYGNKDAIQEELEGCIKDLAPERVSGQIPFLSFKEEAFERRTVEEGSSEFSGPFLVEDVKLGDGKQRRRLVFLRNRLMVQSEAELNANGEIDHLAVSCDHHVYMSAAIDSGECLLVGLGGGGLSAYLGLVQPSVRLIVAEIDPQVVKIAQKHFQLDLERIQVHVGDGLQLLQDCASAGRQFDAILFDVDSKDHSIGVSCPPSAFLEDSALDNVRKCLRPAGGVFVLNLVVRDEDLKPGIFSKLKRVFRNVLSYDLTDDLNEVVYCSDVHPKQMRVRLKKAMHHLKTMTVTEVVEPDDFVAKIKHW